MGPNTPIPTLQKGQRFHVDFGFMRASSEYYIKLTNSQRIVTSFDGYNAYLIITDAATRYTWIFLTESKAPPVEILQNFLARHGRPKSDHGLKQIRLDQGGELWNSCDIRQVIYDAGYNAEPTGSDSANQNAKVERLNGTYGVMVRAMLFAAGLHPKFWSAALLHGNYLKNRLVHSALKCTPYEAWTGLKPDLAHLRVFGALVTTRNPGTPAAKLDRHTSKGVFLGFGATTRHIRYWDLDSHRIKLSNHFTFDECHFSSKTRPPGPQLLFDLGFQSPVEHTTPTVDSSHTPPATPYPTLNKNPPTLSKTLVPRFTPLPLAEFHPAPTAVAASLQIEPSDLDAFDVYAVEMTPDPFGPRFPVRIPLKGTHPTAGLHLYYDNTHHRVQLVEMISGTPANRIPRWRSCLRRAYILQANNQDIHMPDDWTQQICNSRQRNESTLECVFAFDDAVKILSKTGVPQIHFDQLQVIQGHIAQCVPKRANIHAIQSGSHKLHRHKLIRQPDWPEWEAAEFTQLDTYQEQGMFGQPTTTPTTDAIFHWVWIYSIKGPTENYRKKARAVCDGSTRGGHTIISGQTYASTPDMTDFRLFVALAALQGLTLYQTDVTNAFAEAPAPKQTYYMKPDTQFRNWWNKRFPHTPLQPGAVIPILQNLQGHPEVPRQWSNHVDGIIKNELGFKTFTHAPCLYMAIIMDTVVFIIRQVDDFGLACKMLTIYQYICDQLDRHLS